jgi:hypothetical protein
MEEKRAKILALRAQVEMRWCLAHWFVPVRLASSAGPELALAQADTPD